MNETLLVCEIFKSIQGESTRAGMPCSFVRLSGCNLYCSYCDTSYARYGGSVMSLKSLMEKINEFSCNLVAITGGEPLLQKGTQEFARMLLDAGKTVLVETNGSLDISVLPEGCIRIVDVKCPSSGESHSFLEKNISHLKKDDEVKFVIGTREDFEWAIAFVKKHRMADKSTVLFSPVAAKITPAKLAKWIIEENAPVRLQLQLHKIIWGEKRGV